MPLNIKNRDVERLVDEVAKITEAFRRFGKGRHPAALNLGDCLTYATAKLADRPLLFVGNGFGETDIPAA